MRIARAATRGLGCLCATLLCSAAAWGAMTVGDPVAQQGPKDQLGPVAGAWPAGGRDDGSAGRYAGDVIVFTANQSWLSRIYVLRMDGSVIDYHEYEYYIFSDLEVVDNEVYVTDWVAPAVYRVDLETGDLDLVIVDVSLLYLYDLAWDGTYFYAKEWSLNRYELDGTLAGSASFAETVRGGAWDGTYYWTLNDTGQIRCWDISAWPTITEVPENAFAPPSTACRGLWFDGEHFWTAESIDGVLGYIYQFDYDGMVAKQWLEPAFKGYAACVVSMGLPGDVDGDGHVDITDLAALLAAYGACSGDPDYNPAADFDASGCVNLSDLGALLGNYGT